MLFLWGWVALAGDYFCDWLFLMLVMRTMVMVMAMMVVMAIVLVIFSNQRP